MLLKWLFGETDSAANPSASKELRTLVARHMPKADEHTAAIVGALAGLLATVAHADRVYTDKEREQVRQALADIPVLADGAAAAIEALLNQRMAELAHESLQVYTRVLYNGLERWARVEVFEVLMDLAAADDVLDMQETNLLRRIANALGLTEDEYLVSQARHKEKLGVLKPS
ncbi:MAG: TerB family tellurite resistance protein [Myxococcales bacterium]